MNRRAFHRLLLATGGWLAGGPVLAAPARPLVRPPRLRPGDTVGLIAPSGVTNDSEIERATRNVEALGFKTKFAANVRAARGGYAGTVEQRVADLHAMFLDREAKALFAIRGGSGANALLPHMRYDLIRAHPKILTGYSDITALHLAIHRRAGVVTFHCPVATSRPNDYWQYHFLSILTEPQPTYTMHLSIENERRAETEPQFARRTWRHGIAEGALIGGNLSVVAALSGTPYAAQIRGKILFLEDVREAPYRIDRMLTQLNQAEPFNRAAALMLGVFQRAEPTDNERSLTLAEVIDDHLAPLKVPA
ncbi:MAG TPA: LD-carboxypeptidase, partial [Usitatibacteraceae bacterium]|nr:LD-carboxypeptidase [Usitatibacteraceae bacterium]